MKYDLIVVGGGPAGSAAAITAARKGARVLLLERGRFPRHKVCGEFVSAESLGVLKTLLGREYEDLVDHALRIRQARLFAGGRVVNAGIEPAAASIARFELDAALWAAAKNAGVDARMETTVQSIGRSQPFAVRTSAGDFEAQAVVDASGRWSNLKPAKENGRVKWIGLKAHFHEQGPSPSVDLYLFGGGYCGVSLVQFAGQGGPVVNACAMVRADVARSLEEVFGRHPALFERSRGWKQVTDTVSTSPLIFAQPEPERDGVLCAGDAAGFVDPFVGDGISLALHSGIMAAQCGQAEAGVRKYRDLYSRRLMPVFRRAARLRRALALPESVLRWVLPMMGVGAVGRRVVNATRVRETTPRG